MMANRPLGDLSVLLVEDDEIMRLSLEDRLRMENLQVVSASTLGEARRRLADGVADLVITDIRLPDGSGRALFDEVSQAQPGVPVILMTGFGSVPDAVELVKAGAYDYVTKPFELDDFVTSIRRALSEISDRRQSVSLTSPEGTRFRPGAGVLGRSPAMRNIERMIARVASLEAAVLITGESGVGKEVVADFIHHNSNRRGRPFVKVNCAAIAMTLVESELFGHERGAFTGAERRRLGRFEQAQGGTIFLDEIAEIPPEVQVKLLRVLQAKVVERVGGVESIPLDVRIVAATQVDLQTAIARGRFRSDLFWRLNVIGIDVPPLRQRPEDVLFLARRFCESQAVALGRRLSGLSPEAETRLLHHPFPGNVRELRNMIERAAALCDGSRMEVHDLFPMLEAGGGAARRGQASLRDAVEETEQETIRAALEGSDWAIGRAAEQLGISRKNLWEKMRRYGIGR